MVPPAASGWASAASGDATRSILEVGTRSPDMEKRIFAAIILSIGVLVLWSWLAPMIFPDLAKKPVSTKPDATTTAATTTTTTDGAAPASDTVSSSAPVPAATSTSLNAGDAA